MNLQNLQLDNRNGGTGGGGGGSSSINDQGKINHQHQQQKLQQQQEVSKAQSLPLPPPSSSSSNSNSNFNTLPSYRTPLMYGTKSGKELTHVYVKDAILVGFRHIVTCGHHNANNETGVGVGWKLAQQELQQTQGMLLSRSELFLQTCFVPWDQTKDFKNQPQYDPPDPPATIQEQVHLSIKTSLQNLQTTYIDAVIFHNFRAKVYGPYERMIDAWKILEEYVDQGIIRYLGFTSIHDPVYLERIMTDSSIRIKPSIIQNRYHSNRGPYDVNMQPIFLKYKLQIQRFWLLNGSSRGGKANSDMAKSKNVTNAQLMLAFVMSQQYQSCIVGTHSIQHMKDDVDISKRYNTTTLFTDMYTTTDDGSGGNIGPDVQRKEYATKLGIKDPNFILTHN